ncbi:MAG: beta-galactosidase [Sphingobacteriaceae bacterium]|nr:beta-galactosidase [Sphingobacteriaceae bacterium]
MRMVIRRILFLGVLIIPFIIFWKSDEPDIYTVDISQPGPPIITGHLKLGANKNLQGEVLDANSLYFTKNGKPWYPVMGEIHFSRYPKAQWEESILKMKAAGIDVIATYVFWIYHEEEEGKFNWSGDNNLRAFAELCKKHNIYFFVRIGPWCHGEVRNGGFPDWIVKRGNVRKNDSVYLASVKKFYNEIGKQLKGLYFKDGGPIIGTQLENEFRFNNAAGLTHMLTLKKMAVEAGIDVPFYSATGWPGSNQKQDEIIPVWGAYPEAPWDKKTSKLALSGNYLFGSLRNDPAIGSDLLGQHEQQTDYKGYRYPYATAEMGGGNQITYHRRPIIEANDVTALTYVKVGSGANLMGYYMFHGGSNPIGKLSTLQESKATKYPNDYPIISYDFLSPIGEWGQLRPSYRGFKVIHTFLSEFGDRLVQYYPSFPDKKPSAAADSTTLRMSVRSKDNSGFVFISNFQRQLEMNYAQNVQVQLKLKDGGVLKFPETPLTVKSDVQMILPFNMDLDGLNLNYATAQPLCRLAASEPVYIFFSPEGILPEYSFREADLKAVEVNDAVFTSGNGNYLIRTTQPGTDCTMKLTLQSGKVVKIITLNAVQALNAWKADIFGAERLFLSGRDLIFMKDKIRFQSTLNPEVKFSVYPALSSLKFSSGIPAISNDGVFSALSLKLPVKNIQAGVKEVTDLKAYQNSGKKLPEDNRTSEMNVLSPGPQYQTNLKAVDGSRYFEITIPEDALKGISDAFISLDYTGDTGAAYLNGKLIADDFWSGLPMSIGLKRFSSSLSGKKLLFQIVPLTDERQIYFEAGIREPFKGKDATILKSVNIIPQYEVFVSSGK